MGAVLSLDPQTNLVLASTGQRDGDGERDQGVLGERRTASGIHKHSQHGVQRQVGNGSARFLTPNREVCLWRSLYTVQFVTQSTRCSAEGDAIVPTR